MWEELRKRLEQEQPGLRRDWEALSQIPEIGWNLPRTTAFLQQRLEEMGVECNLFQSKALVASIGAGPVVLLRAEMDAMPVQERNGLTGRTHTCVRHYSGHDLHIHQRQILLRQYPLLGGEDKIVFHGLAFFLLVFWLCRLAMGSQKAAAQPNDLVTPPFGEIGDVGLLLGQAQLHLEPAVGGLLGHKAALPQAVECGVGLYALAAQLPVGQRPHGQMIVAVGGYIGIADGISGADVELGVWLAVSLSIDNRGGAQECLGAAVGTLDIDSFQIGYLLQG